MRTKAEAAANPMPGDRWKKGWKTYEISGFYPPSQFSQWPQGTVWLIGQYGFELHFDGAWQRWTENAEFLGGADE